MKFGIAQSLKKTGSAFVSIQLRNDYEKRTQSISNRNLLVVKKDWVKLKIREQQAPNPSICENKKGSCAILKVWTLRLLTT